jgi:predicted O-methyltransferase YrrM
MQYFWDWAVRPLLRARRVQTVLEIGASQGGNTDRILATFPSIRLSLVDPCLDTDLTAKYRGASAVNVHEGRSLEVLPEIFGPYDAILIDGDHNYYTVFNELRIIFQRRLMARGGMILLHDVGEPWALQDMYYEPERVPEAAKSPLAPHGVLTAVRAFRQEHRPPWAWMQWSAEHGLGCLFDPRSRWENYSLRMKSVLWRGIRWRNRVCRWLGLMNPDVIRWGKGPAAAAARGDESLKAGDG